MTTEYLIEIDNLHYHYPDVPDKPVFAGVNLKIPIGKITAIMGPSGTGKTTLLRLIGAQLIPTAGVIKVAGRNVHHLSIKELLKARQKMGLLFQSGGLFTNLNVFDNVAFPLREHTTLSETMIRDMVLMKLEAVGLRGARYLMPAQLSGGMARRVALARAIALDPELIMYDEPFTGQDPISMGVLVNLVKRLNRHLKMTTIIISHDVPETFSIADYVYMISGGVIVGEGTPTALMQDSEPHVRQFIQGLPDGIVPFHYPAIAYPEDLLNA